MFETISNFFSAATGVISSVSTFIVSIPGYIDFNIAGWCLASGLAIFGLLQLRKFFPEAGAFLGALSASAIALVIGMIIRKKHDDVKKPITKRKNRR